MLPPCHTRPVVNATFKCAGTCTYGGQGQVWVSSVTVRFNALGQEAHMFLARLTDQNS